VNSCSQNILIGAGGVRDHRPSVVPLGPELLAGAGLGPLFVLIFLVGLIKVDNNDTGVASGLLNVGQQVGGAIGLAIVGAVAWSVVASTRRSAAAAGWRASARRPGGRGAHGLQPTVRAPPGARSPATANLAASRSATERRHCASRRVQRRSRTVADAACRER